MEGGGGGFDVECFVCLAYGGNSFLLRYVSVEASNVHGGKNHDLRQFRLLNEVNEVCHIF